MVDWIVQREKDAVAKVQEVMACPMPDDMNDRDNALEFDPWEIFPCLYGSYDKEFDLCAIEVLTEVMSLDRKRDDLAADMFREMLCNLYLCSYGTSPRVCFPTSAFKEVLPELVEKWKRYSELVWPPTKEPTNE